MEYRDALKMMRCELGISQTELANSLHISVSTVSRWELGRTSPNRSIASLIIEYASGHDATQSCIDALRDAYKNAAKSRLEVSGNNLYSVEHSSLRQIIDDSLFPIYVCDIETDEILYMNQIAYNISKGKEPAAGKKCYKYLMDRDTPCECCNKEKLTVGKFSSCGSRRFPDGKTYRVQGKLIQWNGRLAQVRFFFGEADGPANIENCDKTKDSRETVSDSSIVSKSDSDITQTTCEKPSSANQEQLLNSLNYIPSGIAIIEADPNNIPGSIKTVYYNDEFFSYTGYTRDEYDRMIRANEMSFVIDEDIPVLLYDTRRMCMAEIGASVDSTVRCRTKDGGYRWLLMTGQLVERRGDICVINIVLVDITAKKYAIDRQRISEELLRIAAETDKRAMIAYDAKNNTCRVESRTIYSAKFGEVFENVPQSLIEKGVAAPESFDELCDLFSRINNGEQNIKASLRLKSGADSYDWFECNATTVFDSDGLPDQSILVFHNITEQRIKEAVYKKWQQSIATRPTESYTLFRCNLSKNASLDEQDGNLLRIKFGTEMLSFNDRTKMYANEFVYPDDRDAYIALLDANTLLAMFYRGEHTIVHEYREEDKDGDTKWLRLTVETVEYLDSTDVQAFLMYEDIDEAKKAEVRQRKLPNRIP